MTPTDERGFTLIECLIALTIFSVVGVAFLTATTGSIQSVQMLEDRYASLWAVQNAISEINLTGKAEVKHPEILGKDVTVRVAVDPSEQPGLSRVHVAASAGGSSAELSVFVATSSLAPK